MTKASQMLFFKKNRNHIKKILRFIHFEFLIEDVRLDSDT